MVVAELQAALDVLAPKQRGAVVYHYLAELPYAQVGELLGTSEAAARRSAADGIARLRTTMRGTPR
ncbi:MAG: sigma factor-like helix-turn-helix DNA-binding protein [Ilumatobacteraceae bacterium]